MERASQRVSLSSQTKREQQLPRSQVRTSKACLVTGKGSKTVARGGVGEGQGPRIREDPVALWARVRNLDFILRAMGRRRKAVSKAVM